MRHPLTTLIVMPMMTITVMPMMTITMMTLTDWCHWSRWTAVLVWVLRENVVSGAVSLSALFRGELVDHAADRLREPVGVVRTLCNLSLHPSQLPLFVMFLFPS